MMKLIMITMIMTMPMIIVMIVEMLIISSKSNQSKQVGREGVIDHGDDDDNNGNDH